MPPRLSLVTGGAGFIGSALVRALLARGDRVRVLDNLSTGKRDNLPIPPASAHLELLVGDLLDPAALRAALLGVEHVFHLAARVSVPHSMLDPSDDHHVNVAGTLRLLELARAAGVRRLVYSSSAAIYGDNPRLPLVEDEPPSPLSPYAVSKYSGELYTRMFHAAFGLPTVALRYFNVFGPRQDPNSPYSGVLSRFASAFSENRTPTIFGDGLQTRDFIFVDDVAHANLLASTAGQPGAVYNVGRGHASTLLDVAATMAQLVGARPIFKFEPARPGDIRHSLANIERARTQLGFAPRAALAAGLAQLLGPLPG